jgi:hypothetical protein
MANSIASLRDCAARHLAYYTDPEGPRAFRTYDRLGVPDELTPLDCLAPALLSVGINYRQVVPLFRPTGPGPLVLDAMQAVLDHPDSATDHFLDADLGADDGPPGGTAWAAVDAAIVASGEAGGEGLHGFKAVAVTKILHRKRPDLVPIFDSRVHRFYTGERPPAGPYKQTPRRLWRLLQADLVANRDWLAELAATVRTPDERPLSLLRAADIVVWEHETSGDAVFR